MAKAKEIADLLERRISHGDYLLKELPGEVQLSQEVSASRMTARRAMLTLVDKGLVRRQLNGRLVVTGKGDGGATVNVAFLRPAFRGGFGDWLDAAMRLAADCGVRVRPVEFFHWDDATIGETLDASDGVLLAPPAEPIPDAVLERLAAYPKPLVVLDVDLSAHGIRCVNTCPVVFTQRVLDHLASLGHERIDCFNTQPHDAISERRIEQWAVWKAAHGLEGELIDHPVESYGDAMVRGYGVMRERLAAGRVGPAVLAVTSVAAVGAMRAMHEAGLRVGADIALAAVSSEGFNPYLTPSLTALVPAAADPYMKVCLEWMGGSGGGSGWPGPLFLQASDVPLFIGESSGASPVGSVCRS